MKRSKKITQSHFDFLFCYLNLSSFALSVTSGSFPVMGSNVSSGHPQGIGGASVLPQTQAWHSTPSVTAPTSSSTPYSFPLAQNISANSSTAVFMQSKQHSIT